MGERAQRTPILRFQTKFAKNLDDTDSNMVLNPVPAEKFHKVRIRGKLKGFLVSCQ